MGDRSAIEWTDATWNPTAGCTRVSAGCDHCYAARLAATRLRHTAQYGGLATITPSGRAAFTGEVRLLPDRLTQPLRWRKRRRVFVDSMSDLFHPAVPDDYIAQVFAVMHRANRHTFQVLTKRPERMAAWLRRYVISLPHVWLGTSCETQATAEERIPWLLWTAAAVRFLSLEPLLGPIDLTAALGSLSARGVLSDDPGYAIGNLRDSGLSWVIVGGESGPSARPCDVEWVRSIIDQCGRAGIAVFVKQLGSAGLKSPHGSDPEEWPHDLRVRDWPKKLEQE